MNIVLMTMNTLNMKQIHKTRAKANRMQKIRNGKTLRKPPNLSPLKQSNK